MATITGRPVRVRYSFNARFVNGAPTINALSGLNRSFTLFSLILGIV